MTKRLIAYFLMALLTGCAAPQPLARVEVPVAVPCPPPPIVERPALPLSQLNEGSAPDAIMRAYVASVEILMGYAKQLETLLDGYREQ